MADPTRGFVNDASTGVENWRGIVLFGRNVASYKFALAKSLLEIASQGHEAVALADLAVPFSGHICDHLTHADRQGTFRSSRFLDACRFYNAGRISRDELVAATEVFGFNNVIDAFHTVGSGEVPTRFFHDERSKSTGGIRITDDVFELANGPEAASLAGEVEARWRLVEEAWAKRADGDQMMVLYDAPREILVPALTGKRRTITEVRPALNGYQKGHCFYCFQPISVFGGTGAQRSDVDHFLPHSLMARGLPIDLDQVWNLVLSCERCNRGEGGKFAKVPHRTYLTRISRRNEYLIGSHHPLRETLIHATGSTKGERVKFLNAAYDTAQMVDGRTTGWKAVDEEDWRF